MKLISSIFFSASLVTASLALAQEVKTEKYTIDPEHTTVEFEVPHLVISTVRGKFKKFYGDLMFSPTALEVSSFKASVQTDSIDTGIAKRDTHLKSDDFFNATKFPKLTMVSKKITKKTDKKFDVETELTIRDVTKTVTFEGEYKGNVNAWGKERAAFKLKGTINRKEFGLKFAALADGKVVVGDDLDIIITAEAVRDEVKVVSKTTPKK